MAIGGFRQVSRFGVVLTSANLYITENRCLHSKNEHSKEH